MIVYEDKSADNSILDEWMGKATTNQGSNRALPSLSTSNIFEENKNKTGLGFTSKKDKSKTEILANEPLAKILLKQQKKNQKRAFDQVEQQANRDLHGIIETDIFEESRTSLIKPIIVASNRNQGKQPDVIQQQKKKQKVENSQSTTSTNNNQPGKTSNPKHQTSNQKKGKGKEGDSEVQQQAHLNDFISESVNTSEWKGSREDGSQEKGEKEFTGRKRKKTRSKQKNIRKDNRSHEDKPEYLRLDSEIYRGRELTEETKRHLGLNTEETM